MKYCENAEEALSAAKEKVSEAVDILEDVLPDTAEELSWICENIREEILAVRSGECLRADGVSEGEIFLDL